MCGITGGWSRGNINVGISDSLKQLRHRGPDDCHIYTCEEVSGPGIQESTSLFMGTARLSIIDPEGGRQPLCTSMDRIVVCCNGEIYNYKELRKQLKARGHRFKTRSDTEVLIHLYEDFGADLCSYLRGMYAFAIWDRSARTLFLGRDRFGQKPLYYCYSQKGFFFASEIKALRPLLNVSNHSLKISQQGIYDYLSLAAVPQPATIYKNIKMLPPACLLSFDGKTVHQSCYWKPDFQVKQKISYGTAKARLRELIAESVQLRLRSDVPLGLFLSGGLDSSVIAYEAAKNSGALRETFTVSSGDPALDEVGPASRTAQRLGLSHTSLDLNLSPLDTLQEVIRVFDQPFGDPSAIPTLAVSRLAGSRVKVVLGGDGGDELFGGYRRYLASRWARLFWLPGSFADLFNGWFARRSVARRSSQGFLWRFLRGLNEGAETRYMIWTTDMLLKSHKRQFWRGSSCRDTEELIRAALVSGSERGLGSCRFLDLKFNLPSVLLVKQDMATMASSLESRAPFLDHKLAEFVFSLPPSFLLGPWTTKRILRDAYKQSSLSDEVIRGTKKGFEIPLERWLGENFRELLFDSVGSSNARVREYLDGTFIDSLLTGQKYRDLNLSYVVYSLLVLELWLSKWS